MFIIVPSSHPLILIWTLRHHIVITKSAPLVSLVGRGRQQCPGLCHCSPPSSGWSWWRSQRQWCLREVGSKPGGVLLDLLLDLELLDPELLDLCLDRLNPPACLEELHRPADQLKLICARRSELTLNKRVLTTLLLTTWRTSLWSAESDQTLLILIRSFLLHFSLWDQDWKTPIFKIHLEIPLLSKIFSSQWYQLD